jgi:hypothetical protein
MKAFGLFIEKKQKKNIFLNNPVTKNQNLNKMSFSGLRQFLIFQFWFFPMKKSLAFI